jgi:hypothetical protein
MRTSNTMEGGLMDFKMNVNISFHVTLQQIYILALALEELKRFTT